MKQFNFTKKTQKIEKKILHSKGGLNLDNKGLFARPGLVFYRSAIRVIGAGSRGCYSHPPNQADIFH
jgi:hypothetical protein